MLKKSRFNLCLCIYITYLVLDLFFPSALPVTIIKVGSIALCFAFTFKTLPEDPLLTVALGFTLLADFCLAADNSSAVGVGIFCLAQITHLHRLTRKPFKPVNLMPYYIFLALTVLLGATIFIDDKTRFLPRFLQDVPIHVYLALIYAVTLGLNTYFARAFKPLQLGFILFILCDLNVALSYLSSIGIIPAHLTFITGYVAWVFYFPSQAIISSVEPPELEKPSATPRVSMRLKGRSSGR